MRLLLDTHALLWWLADMPQLGANARMHIERGETAVLVSAVSAWEIEIKRALGKLKAPNNLEQAIEVCHFEALPIDISHAIAAEQLPRHHDDPFDRMLVGQATVENLVIVTQDRALQAYGVDLVAADE